ncbi:MAG: hypothetical protein KatS3mg102_2404 [Planctomycetota bacterium]|nr:MAG: hypothetical protein KatS3mg102_2404 [Planctomycetota bacterium]
MSYHGFALQVARELGPLREVCPCGLAGEEYTSLSRLLGREVGLDEVRAALLPALRGRLLPYVR